MVEVTSEHLRKIGKYDILGEIGQGAMGVVYRARDPHLDRLVALKAMHGGALADPESKERFLREARSVARLQHPNVITVYELGEVGGVPFIAMEYLVGETLADAIARDRFPSIADKLRVVEQLCAGLAYAHANGVIHRDVKPANVILLPDRTAKLLDFGIARLEGGTFATRTGIVLGTPNYMAPEQFTDDAVDHRVDLWAVGVILYELLTGKRPFDGTSVPTLIYRIVHTDVPEVDPGLGVPAAVGEILARALRKQPEERYPDLAVMGEAVRRAASAGGGGNRVGASATQRMSAVEVVAAASVAPLPSVTKATRPLEQPPPAVAAVLPAGILPTTDQVLSAGSLRELGEFGERSPLQLVAVSPGGAQVAVGGIDGSIRMWSLDTRMRLVTLRSRMHLRTGHAALTSALTFNDDGTLLASGHLDGAIYLWQVASGLECEAKLRHEGAVRGLAFTRDRTTLVSAGMDAQVKLWELEPVLKGDARRQMRRQPDGCTAFAMAADDTVCVTGHGNLSLRVHDPISGRLLATIYGHHMAPSALAISPGGDLLLSGSRSGGIRLTRLDSRALLRQFRGHQRMVAQVAFFPSGRHFASVAMEHVVNLWDVASPEPLVTLSGNPDDAFTSVAVVPSRGWLLAALADGRIRLWDYRVGAVGAERPVESPP